MQFLTIAELEAVLEQVRTWGLHPAVRFTLDKGFAAIRINAESESETVEVDLFQTDAVTVKARKLYEAEKCKS